MGEQRATQIATAAVLMANILLFSPVAYLFYKTYDPASWPMDTGLYMPLVEDLTQDVGAPHRYRVVTPGLVRCMDPLPGFHTPMNFSQDEAYNRRFFHYLLLNLICIGASSALLYAYLRGHVAPPWAYLGSLLYLTSFYPVVVNLSPTTDGTGHLLMIALILLFEARKDLAFFALVSVAWFTSEKLIVALACWVALRALFERRRLRFLAYFLPGMAGYLAFVFLCPAATHYHYREPGYLLSRVFAFLMPATYNAAFIKHVAIAQAPLIASALAYLWLWMRRRAAPFIPHREMLLFPILLWIGITAGVGNNTGRFVFYAFPAFILFELQTLIACLKAFGMQGVCGEEPGQKPEL